MIDVCFWRCKKQFPKTSMGHRTGHAAVLPSHLCELVRCDRCQYGGSGGHRPRRLAKRAGVYPVNFTHQIAILGSPPLEACWGWASRPCKGFALCPRMQGYVRPEASHFTPGAIMSASVSFVAHSVGLDLVEIIACCSQSSLQSFR